MKKSAGYLALFSTIAALSLSGCGTATKQEADSEAKADTYDPEGNHSWNYAGKWNG